jgi:hypothetical protein
MRMTKNFNRDLDQTDGKKGRAEARSKGRDQEKAPDDSAEVARERSGEGFKGPEDEYAETGSRGAGYRDEDPKKQR